jgi:hypothetical protein
MTSASSRPPQAFAARAELTSPDLGTMTNAKTTLLYGLSTLAQTCAALAAFVGTVALYKLQSLRDQHRDTERELRVLAGRLTGRETDRLPVFVIVEAAVSKTDRNALAARALHDEWATFRPRVRRSSGALGLFEAWNLLVIGVALVRASAAGWSV